MIDIWLNSFYGVLTVLSIIGTFFGIGIAFLVWILWPACAAELIFNSKPGALIVLWIVNVIGTIVFIPTVYTIFKVVVG
jgi:hypothetical protein